MDGRSTGSLDCFPSKRAYSISAFPTDSQSRPPPAPIRGGRDESELEPNTADFFAYGDTERSSEHPASDSKLTHSLGIYRIRPPLVMDKLIPVNLRAITSPPEMGPLLDVECKPVVIIKPRFILVTYTDHLSRNKTFNSQRLFKRYILT